MAIKLFLVLAFATVALSAPAKKYAFEDMMEAVKLDMKDLVNENKDQKNLDSELDSYLGKVKTAIKSYAEQDKPKQTANVEDAKDLKDEVKVMEMGTKLMNDYMGKWKANLDDAKDLKDEVKVMEMGTNLINDYMGKWKGDVKDADQSNDLKDEMKVMKMGTKLMNDYLSTLTEKKDEPISSLDSLLADNDVKKAEVTYEEDYPSQINHLKDEMKVVMTGMKLMKKYMDARFMPELKEIKEEVL